MPSANSALLAHSANYRQIVELRPCDVVPTLVELRILSQCLEANHPERLQVRFQAMVPRQGLEELHRCIEAVLATWIEPTYRQSGRG